MEGTIIGIEPTGRYLKPLVWKLKKYGTPVVILNPCHVKQAKELDDK